MHFSSINLFSGPFSGTFRRIFGHFGVSFRLDLGHFWWRFGDIWSFCGDVSVISGDNAVILRLTFSVNKCQDILDALDEMRAQNARHEAVDVDNGERPPPSPQF